jgi:hypothetical protein
MGRHYGSSWRRTTGDYSKTLKIAVFKRDGFLGREVFAASGTITWSQDGEPNGNIGVFISHDGVTCGSLRVFFTQTDSEGVKKSLDYCITLVATPCHFGGVRWWFICPCGGNRCSRLYLQNNGIFGSRKALKLSYESQRHGKKWRMYDRIFLGDRLEEYRKTIRYPYRNGKPTRKMRHYLRLECGQLNPVDAARLEQSLLCRK